MRAGSESGFWAAPCCCCQNCITMAMLAAPQAFFSCFTKGTSSHSADGSAARRHAHASNSTAMWLWIFGNIRYSAHRHNNENQCGDGDQNDDQVAVADPAGGEVGLCLVGARGKLREFAIAQTGNSILHLSRIHMRRLQSLFCGRRGDELPDGLHILLARLGGGCQRTLQLCRAYDMCLRNRILRNHEHDGKRAGGGYTDKLP